MYLQTALTYSKMEEGEMKEERVVEYTAAHPGRESAGGRISGEKEKPRGREAGCTHGRGEQKFLSGKGEKCVGRRRGKRLLSFGGY